MSVRFGSCVCLIGLLFCVAAQAESSASRSPAERKGSAKSSSAQPAEALGKRGDAEGEKTVEMFAAMKSGEIDVKLIARDSRGGNVLIPTFALERAQEILFALHQAVARRRFPRSLPVFLDSPMAVSATEIYRKHPECFPPAVQAAMASDDPFSLPALTVTPETADSAAINRITGGAVILAGAGMCTGGRIRHHLRHNLANPNASVVFVGFAARGTLARQIIDGAKMVKILGDDVAVRARVHTINGFSAHADQAELLDWHRRIGGVRRTFLVHGEAEVMDAFATCLASEAVVQPALHQVIDL